MDKLAGAFVWLARISALCLAILTLALPAAAARKAFIVGNSNYIAASPLPNPSNDARDLAQRLSGLGYVVTLGIDVTRAQFLQSFQDFARSLAADDLALFFFAGHGLQIGGENYLFPVDARVEKEADTRTALVPLNAMLADLTQTTRNRLVLLDACRNNPFEQQIASAEATRSAGPARGLARVYAGVGSFIAYSTQPGNVALDGAGRNSPFTGALLKYINDPGADVHAVMRRVRGDVQRATAEQQLPWENSSLVDEVAFAAVGASAAPSKGPVTTPATKVPGAEPRAKAASSEVFSYVTGLDPKGDNFLALRTNAGADATRIATMGPDTLLKVTGSSGAWKQVALRDGTTGWAHGHWIACCRTETGQPASAAAGTPKSVPVAANSCDALWTERNAIWHRAGYCFTTDRAKQAFGNAGCSRDQAQARAVMSGYDRSRVDQLVEAEKRAQCRP